MSIQRTRFHQIRQSPPQQTARTEIIEPIAGLNRQRPATNLRPGETPFSQNIVMGDRYLEPRSGLSQWGTSSTATIPLGYLQAVGHDGSEYALVLSDITPRIRTATTNWAAVAASTPYSSASTAAYFSSAYFTDPTSTQAPTGLAGYIICNWFRPVMTIGFNGDSSLTAYDAVYSIDSFARYVTKHDDRAILFHTSTDTTYTAAAHPTRVIWSARGNPTEIASGGGFEDLQMQGNGTGAIPERDRLVLLSEKEVWAGRPRRDAYAYDFFTLDKAKGCPASYDRTPQNTEAGTIWLGEGFQFYHLIGNDVRALGDKVRDLLRDEMREWRHCWSLYNPKEHIYSFFYSDTTGEYPTKALFLRTDTVRPSGTDRDDGAWFLQDFGSIQLTAGGASEGDATVFSSTGTAYRLLSSQTNDVGTDIDWRWRSHGMRAEKDLFPYEALQEFWLESEYNSTTTSTVSVYQSTDNGASFTAVGSASITSGINYDLVPISAGAARNQMFELRGNDGTKPRLARMHLKLRGYTGRHSG